MSMHDQSQLVNNLTSEDLEQQILRCVISNPHAVYTVIDRLEPKHFWMERHRAIWTAIQRCVDDGHEPEFLNITTHLSLDKALRGKVPGGYVSDFNQEFVSSKPLETFAEKLIELYRRRVVHNVCYGVAGELRQKSLTYEKAKREFEERTEMESTGDIGLTTQECRTLADERIQRALDGKFNAFSCGVEPVDRVLGGGFHESRYYLIAARPKMGKTKLAVAACAGLMEKHQFAVDFWYTDGSHDQIYGEFLTALSGVSAAKIYGASDEKITDAELKRVRDAQDKLDTMDLRIIARGSPSPEALKAQSAIRTRKVERFCVVADYVQNFNAGFTGNSAGFRNATETSKALASVRTDLGCIVIGLAQFNRSAHQQSGVPQYHQLRSSGQLEQDVNDLLVWHRPKMSDEDATEDDKRKGVLHHQLSKHSDTSMCNVDALLGRNIFQIWDGVAIGSEQHETPSRNDGWHHA